MLVYLNTFVTTHSLKFTDNCFSCAVATAMISISILNNCKTVLVQERVGIELAFIGIAQSLAGFQSW